MTLYYIQVHVLVSVSPDTYASWATLETEKRLIVELSARVLKLCFEIPNEVSKSMMKCYAKTLKLFLHESRAKSNMHK